MRVFLDTNVLVSAFTTRGLCADLMRLVLTEHTLLTSVVVMDELEGVLSRKFGAPADKVEAALDVLERAEIGVAPAAPASAEVDVEDAWVLASALSARAEVMVTGDRTLPEPGAVDGIPIVSPRGFWDLVTAG